MGTSLSGLTPATTFDGLLKTSDNDAITSSLKTIGSGDGTDSCLQLSDSALKVNSGAVTIVGTGATSATTSLLVQNSSGDDIVSVTDDGATTLKASGASNTLILDAPSGVSGFQMNSSNGQQRFRIQGTSTATRFTANNTNDAFTFVGNGIYTSGAFDIPSARLHVKGSGATSATTPLLVENSSGDELFKLTDDGNINMGEAGAAPIISAAKNSGKSLKLGNQSHLSAFDLIQLKTWNGTSYTEAMRITGNTDQFVSIGETNPTSRLHVKGSGNDSTTTSLLVQNSAGTDLLKVSDDGRVLVDEYIYPADGTTNSRLRVSNSQGTYMYYSTGNLRVNPSLVYTSTTYGTVFSVSSTTGDFSLNEAIGAKMAIKGNGATSATTALLVENSAGTDLFKVQDDGGVAMQSFKQLSAGSSNYGIILEGTTSMQFKSWAKDYRFFTQNGVVAEIKNDGSTIIGGSTPDASAKLQVDSTTQGFLPPRMTGEQIDAIESPASGLIIYNTTTNKAVCYNGTSWNDMF